MSGDEFDWDEREKQKQALSKELIKRGYDRPGEAAYILRRQDAEIGQRINEGRPLEPFLRSIEADPATTRVLSEMELREIEGRKEDEAFKLMKQQEAKDAQEDLERQLEQQKRFEALGPDDEPEDEFDPYPPDHEAEQRGDQLAAPREPAPRTLDDYAASRGDRARDYRPLHATHQATAEQQKQLAANMKAAQMQPGQARAVEHPAPDQRTAAAIQQNGSTVVPSATAKTQKTPEERKAEFFAANRVVTGRSTGRGM